MSVRFLVQISFLIVALFTGWLLAIAGTRESSADAQHLAEAFFDQPTSAETLPDITFLNQMNEEISFSSFRGKAVLVNLWATWCPPCIKELPSLDALQGRLGSENFEVVAIAVERAHLSEIADFYRSHGITNLRVYLDSDQNIPKKWRYAGLPTTLLVDADGREVGRYNGPTDWDSMEAIAGIFSLLPTAAGEN